MDRVISFTPAQILAIAGGFSALCVAVGWVVKIVRAAKAPAKRLEERIAALEAKDEAYQTYFSNDKRRLDAHDEGNRVTQRAILALLSHAIDGNEVESLRAAKAELHNYLIEKA